MNINIYDNNKERVINFLQDNLKQLINYNTIDANNLILICNTYYNEFLTHRYREIENLIITIFSYLNQNTKIYINNLDTYETDQNIIFNTFINQNIKNILGEE